MLKVSLFGPQTNKIKITNKNKKLNNVKPLAVNFQYLNFISYFSRVTRDYIFTQKFPFSEEMASITFIYLRL